MASFSRALADGATALETDAHRTRDGFVVVAHDPVLRPAGRAPLEIKSASLDELRTLDLGGGERVPLLREVLDAFRDVPVNVDIKQREPRMEQAIVDVIGADAPRVLLASFHGDALSRVRRLGYRGPTGLARNEVAALAVGPRALARISGRFFVHGARAQVPRQIGRLRFDTQAFVDKCHAAGVAVDYWVINDVAAARALLALGADGIMSDAPAVVAAALS